MGLYSNTRVDSLNEYASEEFKRTVNVESLIEACIEIRENDYKMFESLLNLDFAEASLLTESPNSDDEEDYDSDLPGINTSRKQDAKEYKATRKEMKQAVKNAKNGGGAVAETEPEDKVEGETSEEKKIEGNKHIFDDPEKRTLNDSKIKQIWNKLVQFFQTIIDKIKAFFTKVIAKLREVLGRDKAIVEKYKDAFTAEKMKGFEGVSNISVPTKTPDEMQNYAKQHIDSMEKNLDVVLGKIKDATTKDAVNAVKYDDQDEDDFIFLSKEGINNIFFKKYDDAKFVPTPDFMKTALESISSRSKVLKAMEDVAKKFSETLNKKKNDLKKAESELKGKKDAAELALAKAAASFKIAQQYSSATTKVANEFTNAATRAFGTYRKLVLIVGKYALKGNKKEATKESAIMDFAIAEASDLYVAESLAY